MTLIQTAKLNGADPMAYVADVLERVGLHAAAMELDSQDYPHPDRIAAG